MPFQRKPVPTPVAELREVVETLHAKDLTIDETRGVVFGLAKYLRQDANIHWIEFEHILADVYGHMFEGGL